MARRTTHGNDGQVCMRTINTVTDLMIDTATITGEFKIPRGSQKGKEALWAIETSRERRRDFVGDRDIVI